jgi:hypothetical protein
MGVQQYTGRTPEVSIILEHYKDEPNRMHNK